MYCLTLIGILFSFTAILPHSATAIKCFKCRSEDDCAGYYDFRSEFKEKNEKFIEECTSFNDNYIPACKYVINDASVVRERGCGDVGVTSRVSYCANRFKDVLNCFCTTDFCNGIDTTGSAVNIAKEHFRRQNGEVENETKDQSAAVAGTGTLASVLLALIVVFKSFYG